MTITNLWINRGILSGAFLCTVIVMPNLFFDAFTTPKFITLTLTSSLFLSLYLIMNRNSIEIIDRNFDYLLYGMCLGLILNVTVNHVALSERIYGIQARSFGFITIFSYIILSWLSLRILKLQDFLNFALLSNVFVCGYFILQLTGRDFFEFETFYSAPFSTLGNPNFVSGFIGFSIFALVPWIFHRKIVYRVMSILWFCTNIFVIVESQSIQGLIAIHFGIFLLVSLHLLKLGKTKLLISFGSAYSVSTIVVFIGLIGSGPLSNLLQSSTLFSRLDYWRSALRMARDNWFFGVGLDSFGDYYRVYRDQSSVTRFGEGQVADAAHNVFLDFYANTGFVTGTLFLLISIYPLYRVGRKIFFGTFDQNQIVLVVMLVAFLFQNLISVNQIGVGIWGWLLYGIVVREFQAEQGSTSRPRSSFRISRISILISTSGTLFFLIISVVPVSVSDSDFLSLAGKSDGVALSESVLRWPQDSRRIMLVAQGWKNAGDHDRAKSLLLSGIRFNPNYYLFYSLLYELPNASKSERLLAIREMERLNPFWAGN